MERVLKETQVCLAAQGRSQEVHSCVMMRFLCLLPCCWDMLGQLEHIKDHPHDSDTQQRKHTLHQKSVFSLRKTRNTHTHKQYWFSYGSMTSLRGAERGQCNRHTHTHLRRKHRHTTREHTQLHVKVSPYYLSTVWPTLAHWPGSGSMNLYPFVHFSPSSTVNIWVSLWLHEPIESNYQAPITPDDIAHCLGFVCFIRWLLGYVVEEIIG